MYVTVNNIAATLVLLFLILPEVYGHGSELQSRREVHKSSRDVGSDVPAQGRSLFAYLIAKWGNIPFPFERLIGSLEKEAQGAKQSVHVLFVPFGRSLQRFAADPDYFKFPRAIVAVSGYARRDGNSEPMPLRGRIFLGYVEPTKTLEVIAYNEDMARFEFQLVTGYGSGMKPRLVYAKRQLCMTCHEAGTPIFPNEPWSETNDNDLLAAAMTAARGSETYFKRPFKLPDLVGRGFSQEANLFDKMVDMMAKRAHYRQMRRRICSAWKDGGRCLSAAFEVALANRFAAWPSKQALTLYREANERFFVLYPEFPMDHAFLPDRDPLDNRRVGGAHPAKQRLPKLSQQALLAQMRQNILQLPVEHDPRAPRRFMAKTARGRCFIPTTRPLKFRLWCHTTYFTGFFDNRDLQEMGSWSFPKLQAALKQLENDGFFARLPLRVDTMMRLLRAKVHGTKPLASCCDRIKLPGVQLSPGNTLAVKQAKTPEIRAYLEFCSGCHGQSDLAYPRQFLHGTNEVQILNQIRAFAPEIRHCLSDPHYPMPPVGSPEARLLKQQTQRRQLLWKVVNE